MVFAPDALKGHAGLVTGGSRGIGKGIVEALARAGATVVFCGRDEQVGERTRDELASQGLSVHFLPADMESDVGIQALVASAAAIAPIDIVVNNVGGSYDQAAGLRPFDAIPLEDWPRTFMKCTFNAVAVINAFLPGMRDRSWGRIINISSTAGLEPGISPADYSSAKAALNTLTMSLSTSLAGTGITANIVAPGPVLTDSLQPVIDAVAESRGWTETGDACEQRFLAEIMPLKTKRIGRPADIGAAVTFIASPAADYITGAHLRVDGGQATAAI